MTVPFIISIAILLGLALFLFNEIRRPDPGPPPRWKKIVRVTLIAIPFLIGCFFFYGVLIEPNRLVLHEETIAINSWPRELDGLRIAVISDIHVGSWFVRDDKLQADYSTHERAAA